MKYVAITKGLGRGVSRMGGGACWVRGGRVKVKDTEYLILTKINIPYPMNHDTLYEEGKDQPVAKNIKDEVYER